MAETMMEKDGIHISIEKGKTGLWFAVSDDLPGLLATGRTKDELLRRIPDAIQELKAASAILKEERQ
jgi:predicted RNase H-like HicB family nuclease